jgi:hypothetical protein
MAGLTQDDLVFLLKQEESKVSIIVSSMVAIILDTERICELLQDHTWVKRMFATVMGTKRAEPENININSAALRVYCAEALTALLEHDRISDSLICNLSVQIDEIQFIHYELRHCIEALEKRLDEKLDKLDNYVILSQEIERKKFGTDGNPLWLYKALAEIDGRTLQDTRKKELLSELLNEKKIITQKPVSVKDFLLGIMMMPEKFTGMIYLELLNYSGNITASLATEALERWHLQTRSNRQYLKREEIADQILSEFGIDPGVELSLEVEFETMAETKVIRISSALERELERKRRQQEIQANMRENAQKLQANVQKGVQGIQSNVKKHMPTVKEFFGNVKEKVKTIPARVKEEKADENNLPPPGTWIRAGAAEATDAGAAEATDAGAAEIAGVGTAEADIIQAPEANAAGADTAGAAKADNSESSATEANAAGANT